MLTRISITAVILALLAGVIWFTTQSTDSGEPISASGVRVDTHAGLADAPASIVASPAAGSTRSGTSADVAEPPVVADEAGMVVRVVDRAGSPVPGVPLGVFDLEDWGDLYFPFGHDTDAAGAAFFSEQELLHLDSVAVALPLDPPVLAAAKVGTEVELILPALGQLRFEFVGADGEALLPAGNMSITSANSPEGWSHWFQSGSLVTPFPFGLAYSFDCPRLGEWRPLAASEQWPGLTLVQPARIHRIVLTNRYPVLVGRMLLADGSAFTGSGKSRCSVGSNTRAPA
jgi:hypothetical protein